MFKNWSFTILRLSLWNFWPSNKLLQTILRQEPPNKIHNNRKRTIMIRARKNSTWIKTSRRVKRILQKPTLLPCLRRHLTLWWSNPTRSAKKNLREFVLHLLEVNDTSLISRASATSRLASQTESTPYSYSKSQQGDSKTISTIMILNGWAKCIDIVSLGYHMTLWIW